MWYRCNSACSSNAFMVFATISAIVSIYVLAKRISQRVFKKKKKSKNRVNQNNYYNQ